MGHPKFSRPKFDTPGHPWKAARIEEEHAMKANHGLKNMREIWKAKSQLRRFRHQAMKLIGRVDLAEEHWAREEQDFLNSMHRKGYISGDAAIDDVLSLGVEDILNRRLQAQVYYKGLAASMKQARQLVVHGHICIGDQKVTIPSYPILREEEESLRYTDSSILNDEGHEIRKIIMGMREKAEYGEDEGSDPEFAADDAKTVQEAADEAPSAEDTITKEGGES